MSSASSKLQAVQRRGQQPDQGLKTQPSSRATAEPVSGNANMLSSAAGASTSGRAPRGGIVSSGSSSGSATAAAAARGEAWPDAAGGPISNGMPCQRAGSGVGQQGIGTGHMAVANEPMQVDRETSAAAGAAPGDRPPGPSSSSRQDGPKVEDLVWHPSDSAVKPIVANRRIERLPEPKWEPKGLPFEPLSLQEMLETDQKDLEAFLTHIYRAVASSIPLKDKVNVLAYFETLCMDTNASNVLINSSLTVLFVRMLRNSRAPLLRVRLASVLGLLVRHATFISEELGSTQVVETLTEALKDKNERVRRR